MTKNHHVALWLTSQAPGAEIADEVSDEEIGSYLAALSTWAYGDVVLGAVITAMYRCRVPVAFAAAVQVHGEGPLQWRYRMDLKRLPSEMSKRKGMGLAQALLVALRHGCEVVDCRYEQHDRPCVAVHSSARVIMHLTAASVILLDEETLLRLLTDPSVNDERMSGYRFCW